MHILRNLGLLKDVLARSDEDEEQDFGWFQFRSGMDDHELIYEVRFFLLTTVISRVTHHR